MRALAAVMICIFHFAHHEDINGKLFEATDVTRQMAWHGINGVFIFFVISGFVIPLSLFKVSYKIKGFGKFMLRRVVRIEIPYIVSILLILWIAITWWYVFKQPFEWSTGQFISHIFYIIPFTNYEWYNVVFWTLAIEFQFYIFIALYYLIISSSHNYLRFTGSILFIFSGFLVSNDQYLFWYSGMFSMGIILFMYTENFISQSTFFILLTLAAFATWWHHSWEVTLFCLGTVYIIRKVRIDHPITNRLGDISYSLYLTHGAIGGNILYLLSDASFTYAERWILLLLALVASIVFAFLFWLMIERPSRLLARKIKI